ncbi:type II toxin-antitoxin system RelE/ParE family toxin [Bradyrhizobium sp. CSA207]|uniref:type II toxin-antitoxin system RelE/ParE family toxin n=1 Tax=Bradyrhizobium sp. CSA207 TaxID=2698826 RepID=UPI0023B17475|nr:type II toxin-antitoxin system RelE/ParE family toxin [Bradyrhizobium sp. CSA207]MDE5440652.1 type II toxin-antitoxin system RelE/ParE family toxin [Bradyrhizobium sp. CSA207]
MRISQDSPRAAARVADRIRTKVERLAVSGLSHVGRPGLLEGTRELVEAPYIIVYAIDQPNQLIDVLAILHGARHREI